MEIGFIGLGKMGRPISANLIWAGHKVTVYDIKKEAAQPLLDANGRWADSPQEVAQVSEIVLTSLPGPPEFEEVVLSENGILAGAKNGSILIDLSTNSPSTMKKIDGIAKAKGVTVLDAPVIGSFIDAEARTLTIIVGGDKKTVERGWEILNTIGSKVFHVGEVGNASALKLINNMLHQAQVHSIAEAMILAARIGLDLEKVYEVISRGMASSRMLTEVCAKRGFKGNFEAGFPIDLACKDQGLVTELGREVGVPLYFANLALHRLMEAQARGLGNKDITALLLPLEELFGVKVRI